LRRIPISITETYKVSGMTCGHCVHAVTSELQSLEGVESIEIDLVPGGLSPVRVTSVGSLDKAAVAAAVDEAGYGLASSAR